MAGYLLGKFSDSDQAGGIIRLNHAHWKIEPSRFRPGHTEDLVGLAEQEPRDAHGRGRDTSTNHFGPAVAGKPRSIRCHVDDRLLFSNHNRERS